MVTSSGELGARHDCFEVHGENAEGEQGRLRMDTQAGGLVLP